MKDRVFMGFIVVSIALFVVNTIFAGPDAALLLSLFALIVAIYELRRDNTVSVAIRECTSSVSVTAQNPVPHAGFLVAIQNRGVRLVDSRMSLSFRAPNGHGWMTIAMPQIVEGTGAHQHLERGMVAVFGWKSNEMIPGDRDWLLQLNDFEQQQPVLRLFSQSYIACEFALSGRWVRAKTCWNRFACWLSRLFDRRITAPSGEELLRLCEAIPTFSALDVRLREFQSNLGGPRTRSADDVASRPAAS